MAGAILKSKSRMWSVFALPIYGHLNDFKEIFRQLHKCSQFQVPSYKVKNCHSSCCIHFIALQAKYRDKEDVVETEALAVAQLSPGKKFIQISTSTSNGVVRYIDCTL